MGVKDIEKITIDDMKPITISFKKDEDELILYKWILIHSNYSGFIKDILKKFKESEESRIPFPGKSINKTEKSLIDLDF